MSMRKSNENDMIKYPAKKINKNNNGKECHVKMIR